MKTQTEVQTNPKVTKQGRIVGRPAQSWVSFPEPQGWSMQWADSGLASRPGVPQTKR